MFKDKKIINLYFLCFILFFEHMNYMMHMLTKFVHLPTVYTTRIMLVFYAGAVVYVVSKGFSNISRALFLPIILLLLYNLSQMMLEGAFSFIAAVINEKLFLYAIPVYVCVFVTDDLEDIEKPLKVFGIIIACTYFLSVFQQYNQSSASVEADYQWISYGLLVPYIFFLGKDKRKVFDYILIVSILLVLLFFGGRGPVLCAMLAIIYRMLDRAKENQWMIVLMCLLVAVIFFYYQNILDFVVEISKEYNFSGSILKYSAKGDVFSDSGRNSIHEIAKEIIADHKWIGCGLGADRYYLGSYGFRYGNYPHNLIYELCIHYGIPGGALIFIVLVYNILKVHANRRLNRGAFILFEICFFSTGFLILLFSSSYLASPLFFAMLALMPKFKKGIVKHQ